MTSLDTLLAPFRSPPHGAHGYVRYSEDLQRELARSGFLGIAREEGYGPLEAALLIEEIATCPVSVEVACSSLIAPLLGSIDLPLVVAYGLGKSVRYLPQAATVCLVNGDTVS